MTNSPKCYQFIGISGSARAGKDTMCRALIRNFKKLDIISERFSIAGDLIKKDLKELLKTTANIDTFTEKNEEKQLIRPLLVEYGKILRKKTNGRYFLDNFQEKLNIIHIIPDIRYYEYEKDEVYWLKNEKNGYLIHIERENIDPANITEEENNKIIKNVANYHVFWSALDENRQEDLQKIDLYAMEIIHKMITTYR